MANQGTINMNAAMLEKTLGEFGVPAKVIGYRLDPLLPSLRLNRVILIKATPKKKQKVRISQISGLSRDLALALKAERLRIEAPVPGESYVGMKYQIPNTHLFDYDLCLSRLNLRAPNLPWQFRWAEASLVNRSCQIWQGCPTC